MVSTVGGVGVTSLAGNLALALRYTLNKRVAVVDLDLQTGAMAVFLNLDPERTIMQLCEGERRLEAVQIDGGDILWIEGRPGVGQLAPPDLVQAGDAARQRGLAGT